LKSKKFEALSSAILRLGLIIPNFILSILFVVDDSNDVQELRLPSILVLNVPLFINSFIVTILFIRELKILLLVKILKVGL
ncbi:hypothetical protein C2G38_2126617, partial [Gigaspora rosea]